MEMADEELDVHDSSGSAGSTNNRLRALAQVRWNPSCPLSDFTGRLQKYDECVTQEFL